MPINIHAGAFAHHGGGQSVQMAGQGRRQGLSGDVIAEIETDKATMEVEAVDEGTVAKLVVAAGTEGVKVNAVIAVLAADGEDVGAAATSGDAAPKAEANQDKAPISPPVAEMSAKPTEGGAVPPSSQREAPPSGPPAIPPRRGRSASLRLKGAPLHRRSRAASPRKPGSTFPRFQAPARTGAW
jgi:pyruvate dehydrogenase E2 component (dihydrolipoamide acetyltransferase)